MGVGDVMEDDMWKVEGLLVKDVVNHIDVNKRYKLVMSTSRNEVELNNQMKQVSQKSQVPDLKSYNFGK